MMFVCLLVVQFIVASAFTNDDPCGVSGSWKNEFGATINISCEVGPVVTTEGLVTGLFNETPDQWYSLEGRYNQVGDDVILGFSVAIDNAEGHSLTTSWTGIHFASENYIHTKWLLSKSTKYNDMWKNTNFGTSVFTKDR